MGDVLTSLGQAVQNNPAMASTLLGGGVGALAGGGSAMLANRTRPEGRKKSMLGSALTGGLAGAAIGGGAGLAAKGLSGMQTEPQGLGHGDALKPGMFTDPETGQTMRIDPAALKANPGLAAQVKGLSQPPNPVDSTLRGALREGTSFAANALPFGHRITRGLGLTPSGGGGSGGGGGGAPGPGGEPEKSWIDKHIPTSSEYLPAVGFWDAALHSPLNLGERVGLGRIRPEASRSLSNLQAGLDDSLPKPVSELLKTTAKPSTKGNWVENGAKGQSIAGQLANSRLSPPRLSLQNLANKISERLGRNNPMAKVFPQRSYSRDPNREVLRIHSKGTKGTTEAGPDGEPVHKPGKAPSTNGVAAQTIMDTKARGYAKNTGAASVKEAPALMNVFGKEYSVGSKPWRVGGRLALYGGLPLAEYAANVQGQEDANNTKLRELMKQYAKPVPTQ